MIKRKTKNREKVRAIPVKYDGIQFQSKIERSMYIALVKSGITPRYEEEVFVLKEDMVFPNDSYERCMNGKGDFKNRGNSKIQKMYYTPDFTGEDFIIEVKGKANERFPIVWKLFKNHLVEIGDKRMLFKPQSLKDAMKVVALIKQKRLGDVG